MSLLTDERVTELAISAFNVSAYNAIRAAIAETAEACASMADEMLREVAGGERVGKAIREAAK